MKQQPNILILYSDQHNAGVLGSEGHPNAITPNLDRLANQGVRFTRAYCQQGICLPSRCSTFTGLYPRTLGCLDNGDRSEIMHDVVPLQAAFRANGYRTAAFGKRHLAQACDSGWEMAGDDGLVASHLYSESPKDNYVSWIESQSKGEDFAWDWAAEFGKGPPGGSFEDLEIPYAWMATRPSRLTPETTMEAWTRRRTVEFLRQVAASEEPFFCWSSFYRPHQPYTPLSEYLNHFPAETWGEGGIHMPASLRQDPATLPPALQAQHRGENRIWRLDQARQNEQLYRDYIAAYYALVMEIDAQVGYILDALEETGLRENTLVIYTADHGDFVGAHGMVEKCAHGHNVYEDILRVPLIFSLPGVLPQNSVCDGLVELIDLYPTLMEICEIERPANRWQLQGRSLSAAIMEGAPTGREFCISESWFQSTIITDRWKLGHWTDPGDKRRDQDYRDFGDMLFDRRNDPAEVTNHIDNTHTHDIQQELLKMLADWEQTIPDNRSHTL